MENKKCACCGNNTLLEDSLFEVCPVCNWEDDEFQNENPDYAGGANILSLNKAKSEWQEKNKI